MFWAQIFCAVLVLDVASDVLAYDDFEELEDLDDDDIDYYTDYDNGQAAANNEIGESERDRARLQEKMITRALSLSEIKEVRGAIKELFSRMAAENPFTPYTTSSDDSFTEPTYETSVSELSYLNETRFTRFLPDLYKPKFKSRKKIKKYKKSVSTISTKKGRRSKYDVSFNYDDNDVEEDNEEENQVEEEEHSYRRQMQSTMAESEIQTAIPNTKKETKPPETSPPAPETKRPETTTVEVTTREVTTREVTTREVTTIKTTVVETTTATSQPTTVSTLPTEVTETTTKAPTTTEFSNDNVEVTETASFGDTIMLGDTSGTAMEITVGERQTPKSNRSAELDIPRLLEIIAGIAGQFETNLTKKLNETLLNMSIPTCTTPTTLPPITSEYDANYTGATIAKCFVCGLEVTGVPMHAHCADAFAGDFLPLVPVDPTAKAKISTFRKYCKYSNVPGYRYNVSHPRHIYGRWSGGCAVRWIDLSGIYTQRTCRNKLHPSTGRHYASKRMAKLEKALMHVENGCITSPMATLVPLSRAISLYARFHACVCTGSWCNAAFKHSMLPYIYICTISILSLGIT